MRLDRELTADLRAALGSAPVRLYLLLQAVAAIVFVARRGSQTAPLVLLVWLGMLVLLFVAWWAGRHRAAHPQPDPVPLAGARTIAALLVVAGLLMLDLGVGAGAWLVPLACGAGGWLWAALRTRGHGAVGIGQRLGRDPRPFLPLLLLVGLPGLLVGGSAYVLGAILSLPSGLLQQWLYLVALYAPIEAVTRRPAAATVTAALVFALLHVSLVLDENHGDLVAALANVVIYQSSVGVAAVVGYRRHRAVVPIGITHALAIG